MLLVDAEELAKANASRIAAQTENESLKAERAASGVAECRAVRKAVEHLTAQRDELLEALKGLLHEVGFGRIVLDTTASTKARAAIAKVES